MNNVFSLDINKNLIIKKIFDQLLVARHLNFLMILNLRI